MSFPKRPVSAFLSSLFPCQRRHLRSTRPLYRRPEFYYASFDAPRFEHLEYLRLQIKLDKPGLIARTRTGYYAEP